MIHCAHQKKHFFQTIDTLDLMIEFYKFQLSMNDMHLIAIVCLFIQSKINEVAPISLSKLLKNIGHGKFAKKDILSAELLILAKLKYQLPRNFFFDFVSDLYEEKFPCNDETHKSFVLKHCLTVYKMLALDYSFNTKDDCVEKYTSIFNYSLDKINKIMIVNPQANSDDRQDLVVKRDTDEYVQIIKEMKLFIKKNHKMYQYILSEFDEFKTRKERE